MFSGSWSGLSADISFVDLNGAIHLGCIGNVRRHGESDTMQQEQRTLVADFTVTLNLPRAHALLG
jgi:hypothetical protein